MISGRMVVLALFAAAAMGAEPVAPTGKEMLRQLLASHDVGLEVSPSCQGVGSGMKDTTIGDYVSGLLAELKGTGGKNWIETSAHLRAGAEGTGQVWECNVVFRRQHGEEEWGWGVTFSLREADRKVIRESFRCTGGG